MKALVYTGKQQFQLQERPVPAPGKGQVLLRVGYAGICGTDMAIIAGKHPRARPPLVPGHEMAGVIADIGPECTKFRAGDRVAVNPLIWCGHCLPCRTGNMHVCNSLGLIGIDCDGGMQQYVPVPEASLAATPGELKDDEAAMIETLAVIIHGVRESGFRFGDTAVVTGAGPIGLLNALVLQDMGASQVFITEIDDFRLERCRRYGFTAIDLKEEDAEPVIRQQTGGEGADVLFECAGAALAVADMFQLVRCRATAVMMSVPKQPLPVDLRALNFKEIRLVGSRVYTETDFHIAAEYAVRIRRRLGELISHRVPLEQGEDAFAAAQDPAQHPLKVLVDCK